MSQSFVESEDLVGISVPVYTGLAELDNMVPESLPEDLASWAKASQVDLELETYPKVNHGFAARPEAKDPKDRRQYEAAFERATSFFRSHQ